MPTFLQKTFLLFLLVTSHAAMAQVKFSATVSAPQIAKNEFVQLRLTVENGKEVKQITPPDFKNFVVVSGPNQESGMTMINGDVKQYISLNYILKPRAPGNFTIASATAKVDGKELKSNTVSVQVSNTLAANSGGGNNVNSPFAGFNPFEDVAPQRPFNDNILRRGETLPKK
jgi:hypothetical protein